MSYFKAFCWESSDQILPLTSLFLPPRISVTHFASPGVPLDAPGPDPLTASTGVWMVCVQWCREKWVCVREIVTCVVRMPTVSLMTTMTTGVNAGLAINQSTHRTLTATASVRIDLTHYSTWPDPIMATRVSCALYLSPLCPLSPNSHWTSMWMVQFNSWRSTSY